MAFQKRSAGDLLHVTAELMTKRRCDRWSFGGGGREEANKDVHLIRGHKHQAYQVNK